MLSDDPLSDKKQVIGVQTVGSTPCSVIELLLQSIIELADLSSNQKAQ